VGSLSIPAKQCAEYQPQKWRTPHAGGSRRALLAYPEPDRRTVVVPQVAPLVSERLHEEEAVSVGGIDVSSHDGRAHIGARISDLNPQASGGFHDQHADRAPGTA